MTWQSSQIHNAKQGFGVKPAKSCLIAPYIALCEHIKYSVLSGGALRRHSTHLGVLNQFAHRYNGLDIIQ